MPQASALHRFLLVISPSPELIAEVERLRALLVPLIGSFSGQHLSAHITLFYADLPAECERDLSECIARGVVGHRPFDLHYNGITHFPDKRTIYIDPVEKDSIAVVRAPIIPALKVNDTLRDAIRETDHPHLTIAAGLKPAQFDVAWEILAPHELRSEEQVREVLLLKRALRLGERYEQVRSFPLG